jgi:hypothetical protein
MAVSNQLYDLVTVLENKMKGVAAYDKYLKDFGQSEARQLFEELKRDDERHVEQLQRELAKALQSQAEPALSR